MREFLGSKPNVSSFEGTITLEAHSGKRDARWRCESAAPPSILEILEIEPPIPIHRIRTTKRIAEHCSNCPTLVARVREMIT